MEVNENAKPIGVDEVFEHLCTELPKRGYVPSSDELLDLAEILFEFIIDNAAGVVWVDEEVDE